jgi:hypothetical protein
MASHDRANEADDQSHCIDGQLELQKLSDVVEHGAAPQD